MTEKSSTLTGSHRVLLPDSGTYKDSLIVFLPGRAGDPANHNVILPAYAQAGFRTIGLSWNQLRQGSDDEVAEFYCAVNAGGDDVAFNSCIFFERLRKWVDEILPPLEDLLLDLAIDDLNGDEGWFEFLTFPWDRIVFAGYSEGASQSAFNARLVAAHGLIMVSGGGGFGSAQGPFDGTDVSDWLDLPALVSSDKMVGLRHIIEGVDYTTSWDKSGVPTDVLLPAAPVPPATSYADFQSKHRLEHDSNVLLPALGHSSTHVDTDLFETHMYMACLAGT